MGEPQSTSVLVRVQARGGKFLGPNVGYSTIAVLDGDEVLFGPAVATGDSGTVDPRTGDPIPPSASRDVIAVESSAGPPAGAYWLVPDATSAGVVATFPLAEPALLEFRASALCGTPSEVTASVMMWVCPGMQLTSDPGVVINIPGLVVSVTSTVNDQIDVTATVTMMCGCPITAPTWPPPPGTPEPYWPETEFQVVAVLTPSSGPPITQSMTFQNTNTFVTAFALPAFGDSLVAVYAVQQAESNVGYAQTTVTV